MAAQTLAAIASAPSPQAAPPAPNEDARAGEPFAALVNEASEGSGGSGKSSEKSSEKPSDALGGLRVVFWHAGPRCPPQVPC